MPYEKEKKLRIIGPPSATRSQVSGQLATLAPHPRFIADIFHPLWDAAEHYIIDPVGAVAQSFKETGGGQFAGKVKPEFYNPCGLKIRNQQLFPGITDDDNPLAHAMFPNWEVGTMAQIQHLRAYTGWLVPIGELVVDPRYVFVVGRNTCENFSDLGGRWAPSPTYGNEIEALAKKLQGWS